LLGSGRRYADYLPREFFEEYTADAFDTGYLPGYLLAGRGYLSGLLPFLSLRPVLSSKHPRTWTTANFHIILGGPPYPVASPYRTGAMLVFRVSVYWASW
jgi:hypothetical protein